MKKVLLAVLVYLVVVMGCVMAFNKYVLAEVSVRYNGKMCKMEIFTSEEVEYKKMSVANELIKQDVLAFCKDKYIYGIELAADKGRTTYVIFYNDIAE